MHVLTQHMHIGKQIFSVSIDTRYTLHWKRSGIRFQYTCMRSITKDQRIYHLSAPLLGKNYLAAFSLRNCSSDIHE